MRNSFISFGLIVAMFLGLNASNALAQASIIALDYNNVTHMNEFVSIDSVTGAKTVLKSFTFPSGSFYTGTATEDPLTGIMYVESTNGSYVAYNPSTNQVSVVPSTGNYGATFSTPLPGGINSFISTTSGSIAAIQSGGTTYLKTNMSGPAASATGENSMAFGAGSSATAKNSVAIGAGSIASEDNTVSVGSPSLQRRITQVAPGVDPNDAVNVEQLHSDLNSAFGTLGTRINQTGAMSSAMSQMNASASGIPADNRVAIGFGVEGGSTAVAFGYQRSITNNVNFTLGGSVSGKESTAGAGLGFGW